MAVPGETSRVQYNVDGSTTAFLTVFVFYSNTNVAAIHADVLELRSL
jgi:hypothetical protein